MEILKLSASSINVWNQCRHKFKLYITNKLPFVKKTYFEYGNLLHEVLDEFFKLNKYGQQFLPLDEAIKIYSVKFPNYATGKPWSEGELVL